jgi:hypothetical protein
MKYLKLFVAKQTESKISKICKKYEIENWSINPEGLVDVDDDVNLYGMYLIKLPLIFCHVSGDFYCHKNKLTCLEGSPRSVGGDFVFFENELTSLEGGPKTVRGSFYCHKNKLTCLEGSPRLVSGHFYCHNNDLTSLENGPETVDGNFYCNYNRLTSLRFAPEVEGEVRAFPNPIADIPKKYLNEKYLEFIVKEQPDWRLYDKNGSMRLDRLEEMIEWGIESNKIKPL